jgi:hypothetical protein
MADYYSYTLKAGVEVQAGVQGKMILIDDIIGADGVDITPMLNSSNLRTMPNRKRAFKCWVEYDNLTLKAARDCTLKIWLSKSDVSLGFADGAMVNVVGGVSVLNDAGHRVPVDIGGGNVQVTATNIGINNTDANPVPVKVQAPAAPSAISGGSVAVGTAPVKLVGDPALKGLRIRNNSKSARLALGGADITMGNAAIILEAGEVWVEEIAPGATWYGVSDTDATDVRVQGVK